LYDERATGDGWLRGLQNWIPLVFVPSLSSIFLFNVSDILQVYPDVTRMRSDASGKYMFVHTLAFMLRSVRMNTQKNPKIFLREMA
jgi:hypothetical protein